LPQATKGFAEVFFNAAKSKDRTAEIVLEVKERLPHLGSFEDFSEFHRHLYAGYNDPSKVVIETADRIGSLFGGKPGFPIPVLLNIYECPKGLHYGHCQGSYMVLMDEISKSLCGGGRALIINHDETDQLETWVFFFCYFPPSLYLNLKITGRNFQKTSHQGRDWTGFGGAPCL
jgi:hypothetical protein